MGVGSLPPPLPAPHPLAPPVADAPAYRSPALRLAVLRVLLGVTSFGAAAFAVIAIRTPLIDDWSSGSGHGAGELAIGVGSAMTLCFARIARGAGRVDRSGVPQPVRPRGRRPAVRTGLGRLGLVRPVPQPRPAEADRRRSVAQHDPWRRVASPAGARHAARLVGARAADLSVRARRHRRRRADGGEQWPHVVGDGRADEPAGLVGRRPRPLAATGANTARASQPARRLRLGCRRHRRRRTAAGDRHEATDARGRARDRRLLRWSDTFATDARRRGDDGGRRRLRRAPRLRADRCRRPRRTARRHVPRSGAPLPVRCRAVRGALRGDRRDAVHAVGTRRLHVRADRGRLARTATASSSAWRCAPTEGRSRAPSSGVVSELVSARRAADRAW